MKGIILIGTLKADNKIQAQTDIMINNQACLRLILKGKASLE